MTNLCLSFFNTDYARVFVNDVEVFTGTSYVGIIFVPTGSPHTTASTQLHLTTQVGVWGTPSATAMWKRSLTFLQMAW